MRSLALIVAAVTLAATACSGSDSAGAEEQPGPVQDTTLQVTESKHFTKAQLPNLALQPSDAPDGMRYAKDVSGRQSLTDVGFILERQIAPVRALNLRGIYDATFDSKKRTSDLRLAARLWLFGDADGAQKWLDRTERDSQQFAFEPLTAPKLGEDSWAGHGNLAAEVITYAFREGNLVVVVSYTTQTEELSESALLAAAQKAASRLDNAAA